MKNLRSKLLTTALSGIIVSGLAQTAWAQLVQDGGFELTSAGNGELGFNTTLNFWTSTTGYNFVYAPGTADGPGANGSFGNVQMWGPGNGSANGLTAASPAGGNFLALDSDFQVGPVTQTITGLTPGDTYALSFWMAGAQQSGFDGPTTDQITASLGADSQTTATINVPSHGFVPWAEQTFDYTASSSSEVLSFLASGGPSGTIPPFVLLDGVSLTQTTAPDTASTAMLFGVTAMVLGFAARRYGRLCRQ